MKRHNRGRRPESEPSDHESEIMTVGGVASYLHCHQLTFYRLVKTAGLPAFTLGSDWRFRRSDVDQWIENNSVVVSEIEPGYKPDRSKVVKPPRKPKRKSPPRGAT